jgi:hypothetical protein
MDATTFDTLIKQLGTTRITRLTALRGLAVGALAAAIGVAAPDDAAAGKKKCPQCKKRKCHNRNGHKRCRCKNKANGTLCSIPGATTATTCLNGSCVAAAGPTPVPPGPPPPGFNCNTAGCVGVNAGLVCNTTTGQCVNCATFDQCGGLNACIGGRCLGFVACASDPDCAGLVPSGLDELICNTSNESPEIEDDVCIFDPTGYFGPCNATNDCILPSTVCVLGACLADCREDGQEDCDVFYGTGIADCVGGICIED